MLLHPTTKTGEVLEYGVVTSAYGRRKSNAQSLIDSSAVRYIDPDSKRTGEWMKALGLQLPSASSITTGSGNAPLGGGQPGANASSLNASSGTLSKKNIPQPAEAVKLRLGEAFEQNQNGGMTNGAEGTEPAAAGGQADQPQENRYMLRQR